MFKKLTDFSYTRSGKEALGFYLAYFVFAILASMVVSGIFSILVPIRFGEAYYTGVRVGTFVSVLSSLTIAYLIVVKKNLSNNFGYILLTLLAGVSAFLGGGLLGMIIPALLTTKGTKGAKAVSKTKRSPARKKKTK